jgi:penicillin-binding protein 2
LPDALAVSSDVYFYKLGELFWLTDPDLLKTDLSQFGFGGELGVDLPYEWSGRVPNDEIKKQLIESGALSKKETPRYLVGDNVNVAIGQGLMAATPLQLANAYSAIANGGFLNRPKVVKAMYEGLTPDSGPGYADLAAGTVIQSYEQPTLLQQLPMPPEVRDPIMKGLHRVTHGKGTYYPRIRYHTSTGEVLFRSYPSKAIPVSGKTGTAQGLSSFSWNDSSVFTAFSEDGQRPYTVTAYLEKSGFGSKAAAPVVKCVFTALSELATMDPVQPSDQLDVSSTVAAPPTYLADDSCLANASTGTSKD